MKEELSEQWFEQVDKIGEMVEGDRQDLATVIRSNAFLKAAKIILSSADAQKDTLLTTNLLTQEGIQKAIGIQAKVQTIVFVFNELLSLAVFKEEKDENP